MFDDASVDDVADAELFKEEPIDDDMQGNCEILTVCQVHKLMEAEITKVQSIVEVSKLTNTSESHWSSFSQSFQAPKARFAFAAFQKQMGHRRFSRAILRRKNYSWESSQGHRSRSKSAPEISQIRSKWTSSKEKAEECWRSTAGESSSARVAMWNLLWRRSQYSGKSTFAPIVSKSNPNVFVKDVYEMQCHHIICRACFKTYLNTTINDNAPIDFIACPGSSCENPVPDDVVYEQLEPSLRLKFRKLTTNAFVYNSRLIKWCISSNCTKAIKVTLENQPAVKCKCGAQFCFKCSEVVHNLIPCNLIRRYQAVKEANLETANWIATNSKQCPQCKVDIEKNAGCNHMLCLKCRYQFCWICMANWNTHQACKPFVPENVKTSDMRWLSVCNSKYQTMVQSIKLDEKMYKAKLRNQELASEEKWLKVGFVKDAVDILLHSRQTLADSFIFEYFYDNNKNLPSYALFKMNQNSLQQSTENLSRILQDAFVTFFEHYNDLKPRVNYAAKYCKDLSKVVIGNVKDGLDGGEWKLLV